MVHAGLAALVTVAEVVEVILVEREGIEDGPGQSIQGGVCRHGQPAPDASAPSAPADQGNLEDVGSGPDFALWLRVNGLPFREVRLENRLEYSKPRLWHRLIRGLVKSNILFLRCEVGPGVTMPGCGLAGCWSKVSLRAFER